MAEVGEPSLRSHSPQELKTMFKDLFEKEYYSRTGKFFKLQKRVGLYIRLETQVQTAGPSKNVDLEKKILEDISTSNGPLSTLVLGDSGTGKSWLALELAKELYDSTKPEFRNKIPVYIPLGRIEEMVSRQEDHESSYRSHILFCYIMNHRNCYSTKILEGELDNLYLDLCKCELILILDGYDELKVESEWWEQKRWMESRDFKDIPRIVSCRPNALVGVDLSQMFGIAEEPPSIHVISPLERIVVDKYISRVPLFLCSMEYNSKVNDPWMMTKSITKDHRKWESAEENSEYKHWFLDKLPELQELAQNVFILTMICQLLPKLVETERIASENGDVTDEFMQKLQEICRTEVLLYDRFTETWFKYQVERRIKSIGDPEHILSKTQGILHHYMAGYAQNLAMRCARLNQKKVSNDYPEMLSNGEIVEGETLFWNLWTPNSEEFHRDEAIKAVEKQLFPQDENDTNLGSLKFLRDSCLLRCDSGYCSTQKSTTKIIYEFLHLSIFEYFLSREVFEKYRGALNYYSNWDRRREGVYFLINKNNINHRGFSGVLSMLVDRAKTDVNFQATLLEAIKRSATLPGIEQMASNAWTILNLSGYSFSGRNNEDDNFQNIQVPGANLRNSICGNSDFTGANFKSAEFNQGWFQGCKFQGANFKKCSFGQITPIEIGGKWPRVLDILCYTVDGFQHVALCCHEHSADMRNIQLSLKNYKLKAEFEVVESTSILILDSDDIELYLNSLIQTETGIFLFRFERGKLEWLDEEFMKPESWYEFCFHSLVNSGKFEETDLNLSHHLEVFGALDSIQKFILFSPNKNPKFCDKQTLMSVYENNKKNVYRLLRDREHREKALGPCRIKFIWIPFGPFKFLASICFREPDDAGIISPLENIRYFSVLHSWKPILCNEQSVPLEIFWQLNSDDQGIQEAFWFHEISVYCSGSYFDDNVILSIPSTANTYFFDLKNNTVLNILKSEFSSKHPHSGSAIVDNMVFTDFVDYFRKKKAKFNIPTKSNTGWLVSKNLDFIALKDSPSTEVFSIKNPTLSRTVLKDYQTPASFEVSSGTYLVYVFNSSLHFEKFEVIEVVPKLNTHTNKNAVEKYFSEDGSLGIVFPFSHRGVTLDVWKFQSEASGNAWKESFDWRIQDSNLPKEKFNTDKQGVLITPRNLVVFYFCLKDPPPSFVGPQLRGCDTERRQVFPLKGIPAMFSETEILMFQNFQKIVVKNVKEFACYSVTEIDHGDEIRLELVHDVTFTNNFVHPRIAFDPNETRSYIFSKHIDNFDCIGVWNLQSNTYRTFGVKRNQFVPPNTSKRKKFVPPNTSFCTVLFKERIMQGYYKKDYFYIKCVIEYSALHPEMPINVSSRPELGWIVAQFVNGDLVILDSRKLVTLFFFSAFQPGLKFQLTRKSPQQVRIALVKDAAGELVWLSIDAASLRKHYEQGKLNEFKDWKVDKSSVPSSSLSLSQVDISSSRLMDNQFMSLFQFHGSLGSPSKTYEYKPFCNLFIPVTDYQHSILITSGNAQPTDLTKKWTVTVISKKNKFKQHAALIIEGILHGGHFVIKAELTQPDNVVIKCESYRGKSEYVKIIEKYEGKQLEVNPEKGMKLLRNIWVDTYNSQWEYILRNHNCNSWCKEKLKVLNLETKFKAKPYKLFADLPKDFELREFQFSK